MHLRVKAAAHYVGVSKSFLDKARCYGGGPAFFKIGAAVVYAKSDLDTWMADRRATSTWQASNDNRPANGRAAA
ncbi:helix-turn-helix transcriptional regulator [Camelimonas lactis]|uniref:helix-turn-helix transcriptional regulator n=1 Tax=Camelimonas lactis TaxID=659006 RepID=UPI00104BCA70|nr:helix-turn-helix domain-containing protein [Camelimonas lactis]